MSDNLAIVVFFLMVPVLMQIVLPLLMLAGYGAVLTVKMLLRRKKTDSPSNDGVHIVEKLEATHT